ncbi:cellulose biosynthesis cyclic di-GMP-binding regulatory protein BcsB [Komagataeibacter sp. FNDCF1]|uniref:cellulose biosynthesis cyclic di-GMP-binding regulatory protein BcsB n=1 Tax=Komagataeibacter sp. FNDCF1 TaxID=2878681 RepID=UPI001E45084D|nr:cellulose biosynthesis cyclic di-GMP-binding regulatory protein BcsB [Komagataeibacter sp. FNDCF1]MCE2565864.1 cellulose biosynthesis cyclic di-GMP-binding regulatory protein BcsB [Komagataeibacter sp. FNDCF1]
MKMVSLIALLVFATGAQAAPVASKAPANQPAGSDLPPLPAAAPAAAASTPAQPQSATAAATSPDPAAASAADAVVDSAESATGIGSDVATVHTYSLRELGAQNALTMRGAAPLQGLQFGIPGDQLVTSARLVVSGAMSPNLQPENSAVTITLNEQYIGTLRPDPSHPSFGPLSFDINPIFFVSGNRLNFNFASGSKGCADPTNGLQWASVSEHSELQITTIPLPPRRQLSRLPQPFFDKNVRQKTVIPFVLAQTFDPEVLKASGILASWFGQQTDFRGVNFPVFSTIPQTGNAVVIGVADELPSALGRPSISGPTLMEVANPSDPNGTILLVTGRDRDEVITASKGVSFGASTLPVAARMDVAPIDVAPRVANDAPSFIPTNRPVRLGELVPVSALQGEGYTPGVLSVPFRVSPDLYTWRDRPYKLNVRFRAPDGPILDVARSHLDVGINNTYLQSYSLREKSTIVDQLMQRLTGGGQNATVEKHTLTIPPWMVFGQDQLQFYFDAAPLAQPGCRPGPSLIHLSVDPDSSIDLSNAYHITRMPNLAYMASAGYPFTTYADLSRSAVVLPDHPNGTVVSAYLDMMGFMGATTWYPVSGLDIVSADHVNDVADRNLIVLSTLSNSGDVSSLLSNSSYQIADGRLHMGLRSTLSGVWNIFQDPMSAITGTRPTEVDTTLSGGVGAMVEAESPLASGRTVLALLSGDGQGLDNLVQILGQRKNQAKIQGDLVIAHGDDLTSYRSSPLYTVGTLPMWLMPDWYMHNHPVRVIVVGLVGCLLIVAVLVRALLRHALFRRRQLQEERQKS